MDSKHEIHRKLNPLCKEIDRIQIVDVIAITEADFN